MRTMTLLLLCAAVFAVLPASADIIYDNGAPDLVDGTRSETVSPFGETAMDFELQAGANLLTDVHWWGIYATSNTPPATDIFTIRIFADTGGAPALTALYEFSGLGGNRVATGDSLRGYDLYAYSADVTPTLLTPNTTYWISIGNDTSNDTTEDWYWADSAQSGNSYRRTTDGATWGTWDWEEAFYLTGTSPVVPEPASMTLLGLGLAGLAVRMRRRKA